MEPLDKPKDPTLPAGYDEHSYFLAESRPLGDLKPHWRDFGQTVSFRAWLFLRDRARKDLFFLGRDVLRKDLTAWHKEPCTRLFVQKDFDNVYHLGYTIGEVHEAIGRQKRKKEMLFLASRGSFKSTLDGIDCVQWLLNCPDIRILILTGEYKLALAFMSEIKGYFYRAEHAPVSYLHMLFPEYILEGKSGTSDLPIECPARIHSQKEPSLWVNSITANLSGWHCDLRKLDDVVTDENSNNETARGKEGTLKLKIDGTDNLVDEWGFTDDLGTPYWFDDYHGEKLRASQDVEVSFELEYGHFPCWKVKPPFLGTPLKELTEDMVELLFPEKLTFRSLRAKLLKNEKLFRCQQLCEFAADSEAPVTFTEEELKRRLVAKAPDGGDCFITWDTSFARTSYADYSAGTCGKIIQYEDRFELYIMEIIFGRWRPSELAYQMVQFEKKWKPKATMVERPAGAELLQMEIQRQAQKYQVALNILWKTPSIELNAKRNRIKGFQTLLANGNVYFLGGAWIDEAFDQFIRYTGESKNRGRKDDIPDSVAYLQFFCPTTENAEALKEAEEDRLRRADQQAIYSSIFDTPMYVPPPVQQPNVRQRLFGSLAR